jgi:lipoprotein NlpD
LIKKQTTLFLLCTKSVQGFCFVTLCILLALPNLGCSPHSIYYDKKFNPPVYFGRHVVRKNETLYSIAWRYGRGFKELAEANDIKPPYHISVGRIISLERSSKSSNNMNKSSRSKDVKKTNVTKGKVSKRSVKNVTKNKKHKNFNNIKWQWPHLGPILAMYYVNDEKSVRNKKTPKRTNGQKYANKGIDISGRVGEAIFAAAAGEVVYAGNGLLGYGNLVIINHNETYLSAYAHNRQILVQEGQKIKIGQKIAEMGRSETSNPMLHFEIRKNGEPVDPMRYLPSR